MKTATFTLTGDEKVPAKIFFDGHSSDVWLQAKWEDGVYAKDIRDSGCGHCCTAMVLNLHGIKINPHDEFVACLKAWGPSDISEPKVEYNYLSAVGIEKMLKSFGVGAKCFGIDEGKGEECAQHIQNELEAGNQVIFWSQPSEKLSDNPFSTGPHYVLAVGIAENGEILIANSSVKGATSNGIQYTTKEIIGKVLYEGCVIDESFTWGRKDRIHSSGYVVVYR